MFSQINDFYVIYHIELSKPDSTLTDCLLSFDWFIETLFNFDKVDFVLLS